jgi:hypothetical protein
MQAQLLKLLVIVMSVAIVVALALVAYGISGRVSGPPRESFGARDIALPAGCRLAEARLQEGRLVLRLDGPAERDCQQVVLLDPASGAVLGRITGRPGSDPQ